MTTIASTPAGSGSTLVLASDEEDARAVESVRAHHAELAGRLQALVAATIAAASGSADDHRAADLAGGRLVAFLTGELLPHALAEEEALYPAAAAQPEARLLVEAMLGEHRLIQRLTQEVSSATRPVVVAATAQALAAVFETHLEKENDLILPLLAADPGTSVAGLLDGMHHLLGHGAEPDGAEDGAAAGGCAGSCGCGGEDAAGVPELDVRAVPHAIRHATVFGAFDAVPAGSSLDLVAPHDPVPLLRQLTDRTPSGLAVDYLESGPEFWRVRLTRL